MYGSEESPRQFCQRYHPGAKMLVCHLPCWPFEAEYCEQCEEVVTYWGTVKMLVWWALIGWHWNGAARVSGRVFLEKWRK